LKIANFLLKCWYYLKRASRHRSYPKKWWARSIWRGDRWHIDTWGAWNKKKSSRHAQVILLSGNKNLFRFHFECNFKTFCFERVYYSSRRNAVPSFDISCGYSEKVRWLFEIVSNYFVSFISNWIKNNFSYTLSFHFSILGKPSRYWVCIFRESSLGFVLY